MEPNTNRSDDAWSLMSRKEQPDWLVGNNEFILDGHRPQLGTAERCFYSIFRIHNETVNIWSHLIGLHIDIPLGPTSVFFIVIMNCRRHLVYNPGNSHFQNRRVDGRNPRKDAFRRIFSCHHRRHDLFNAIPHVCMPFRKCLHVYAQVIPSKLAHWPVSRPSFSLFKTRSDWHIGGRGHKRNDLLGLHPAL